MNETKKIRAKYLDKCTLLYFSPAHSCKKKVFIFIVLSNTHLHNENQRRIIEKKNMVYIFFMNTS